MAFLVEQVNTDGTIVCDYDQTLSVRALYERIATYFPGIYRDEDGIICGVYQGRKYSIRAKNVSYLGNPHPVFKKRIQIANDLKEFYQASLAKGYRPILLGYTPISKRYYSVPFGLRISYTKKPTTPLHMCTAVTCPMQQSMIIFKKQIILAIRSLSFRQKELKFS